VECAVENHDPDQLPIRIGRFDERLVRPDRGIVDQDVDPAELAHCPRHHRVGLILLRDVGNNRESLDPTLARLARNSTFAEDFYNAAVRFLNLVALRGHRRTDLLTILDKFDYEEARVRYFEQRKLRKRTFMDLIQHKRFKEAKELFLILPYLRSLDTRAWRDVLNSDHTPQWLYDERYKVKLPQFRLSFSNLPSLATVIDLGLRRRHSSTNPNPNQQEGHEDEARDGLLELLELMEADNDQDGPGEAQ